MNKTRIIMMVSTLVLIAAELPIQSQAAIALDRTRIVFDGGQKSMSVNVSNENKQLPYLAQAWIEDAQGNKVLSPLTILPPVQRIEPGARSQVKLQSLPGVATLPQNIESIYYFNLREIPPRTNKPNTLQLALQTRIKLFYRPKSLKIDLGSAPWQENITLTRRGDGFVVNNPEPYFLTISEARGNLQGSPLKGFEPVMIAPKSSAPLKGISGNIPVLSYINDYGGREQLSFSCTGSLCMAKPVKQKT